MVPDTPPLTPNQFARRLGIGIHKVLAWIRSGELRAINVALNTTKRPQWSIPADAVTDFETRRAAVPVAKPARRRRRRDTNVIEFF
jgi:hypothetical protein